MGQVDIREGPDQGDLSMCLTPTVMLAFLSMISPDKFETTPDRIVIHAEVGEVLWTVRGQEWCIASDCTDTVQAECAAGPSPLKRAAR